jgi:hemolysin-activating ACP:hemolysin acyltransferase
LPRNRWGVGIRGKKYVLSKGRMGPSVAFLGWAAVDMTFEPRRVRTRRLQMRGSPEHANSGTWAWFETPMSGFGDLGDSRREGLLPKEHKKTWRMVGNAAMVDE